MPILYHPLASYQYYIAPGSSSVSITAAIFNAGGVTLDNETTTTTPEQPAGGDFDVARFAVPSGLVTTDATIDIDYVAENVNPAEYLTSAPAITHQPSGVTYMGTKTFLTFPNSTETSSFVYKANVSLPMGGSTLELRRNSSDTQYVHVTRKSALDTITVTNDAGFASVLDGAYSGDGLTLDAIYVNYNARMNDVWAAQTLSGADTRNTQRNTYLTIAPTGGNEISWSMNNDVPLDPRTSNTWILYKNITIGSSSDDWTSGNYYNEDYSRLLFDGCTFESKYNIIDYGYMKRPNGIRVTILGSQADVNSLVYGEYFYQGEGGQSGHSADSESTNFGYVGLANGLNVYEYGTSAGVSFASFNVYGTIPDVGVSGSFVAGATVEVAYNPVLNKGNSTAAPRQFTLESYIGVSGDNMPIGDDGRTLITILSPTRKYQISGFMGFSGCNFINTPGPIMSYCSLVKNCFYNGHRSDICTGVACGINNRAVNTVVRRETNDYYGDQVTHIDLHQWWGTTASHPDQFHENFYYGGNLVEDEEGANISSLQHTLFDRSVCCSSNSHIFMRKSICRYKTDVDHNFLQLAGQFDHVGLHEVECIGVPGTPGDGVISYRMAYNDQRPDNGVNLSNFYVHGCSASRFEVSFSSISGLPNINVRAVDVLDISDVSSYLNGITTEGFGYGITFSDCSISPATQYGTFAADTANGMYRTNTGTGRVFVNTFVNRGTQLAAGVTGSGINSFTMYPDKFFIGFNSQTERDAFNTLNPKIDLSMIADVGTTYNYAWNSVGSSPTWGTLATVLFPADETTGTTWDSNWADLYARFGDNPQYDMRETGPLTRFFTPDFTLPNPQPSESSFNNGGHTGGQAVGYIEMPERIWTPGATVDFCVSANVVDLEGINKVVVSCHGSTAEVSTVTKGSNGVQGYWFTMTLPSGATTGTPKLYADIIPFNGESRVVEKEFRSLTPTYVDIAAGDLTGDIITPYIGHGFGTIGSDNMVLRLGAGTFYLTQAGLGTLNNKWQEITTNGDVDTTVVICSDPSNLGRTSGTPSVRFDHTIFNGVTVDFGPAQLISGGRGTYVGFEDCSLVDSWWNQSQGGRPYGIFNGGGIEKNELQQSIFDQYSSPVREPVFEVYNTAIDSPVGGGAVLYHNVTMNCSFDPIFMQLGQYNNGSTAGQAYYERGFHINKLESLGGPWRFGGRQHFRDFLTVAGVTLEGSNTRITFTDSNFEWEGSGYTHEDGTSTTPADEMYLSRSDYMIGRWNSTEALTTYNREWIDPAGSNQVRLYGQGNGITHSVLALNTNWVSSGLTAGDRIIVSTWAHPDAFQISRNTTAAGFTGATVDNWLIQDYRCYQDHQPMLFHSSTTAILNCVVDNCSFEQYSEPPDNYFAQFEGLPKQFAIKNTSFPRTKSFSIRNNAAEYIPGDMFLIDGCFFRMVGGDAGGPSMPYIRVTNSVYQQAVNATGISFGTGTSILAADQYTIANGRISKFGVPQSSVATTTTRALPYTIHGTERSATREVGAYAVGDTPSDWVAPTSEVIIPAGSLTSLQLLIDNTPVGGTLDLNGGVYSMMGPTQAASFGFTADYNDVTGVVWNGINVDESITITDGTISISELHTPTNRGDGTFSVPNTTNESLIQMFDPDSSQELIRLATYPPQYRNRTSTFFVDANSFDLNAARGATVDGGPITDKQIDGSKPMNGILTQNLIDGNYYTSGFTVIGATLVNDIKTMLDSVVTNESAYSTRTEAATNVGMIININPNQIYPQVVGEYAEGTSGGDDILGITFAGGTAEWFSRSADNQYIREFNFFGRVSFGLTGASGTYYTYGDDEIIYKPLSGKCNNIYLPHLAADQYNPLAQYGGFVLRNDGGLDQAGGRSDIRFNNCTTIGGGAYNGTHSGKHFHDVRAQGGEVTSSLTLRNHTTYIGNSIYNGSNGATFDVEECRFIGPATNGIGGAGGDSFFINKCEFRGGFYKSSAISKTNSTMLPPSIGKLQPTRVTNSVFDFDSNHGQAISAYASTYINTEISGNVFVNTPRPVSAQWGLVDASLVHDLSSYGGFTFSNNLQYMHQLPAQNATGQAGIAFNGDVPRTLSMELSSLLPGSPTEDGFYGITAGDSKYNLSGYCVELTNGDLPRVKIQLLGRGYRVRGGTGYILGNIDRWDLVDTQENYFNSRYEIDGRSGPSGTLLNGDITIHEISGGTVGDVVVSGITCENTLLVTNIPDTHIENNTVMLSRDIITEEADGLLTQNIQNCLNLQFGGGSSGIRRNLSTLGGQKTRRNIILGHQGTNATRRAGKTGGYDILSGVTLDVNANGVYSLNENIVSLGYGENEVTGNTFLLFGGFSEGFVDGYTGPLGNQRKNFLSKSLGTTIDAYYNSDERIGTTAQQAEAFDQVFTWNNGDGTIEPKSGYGGGCRWSSYPTWNEIDSLGYTFSTIYTPREITPFTTITQSITGYDGNTTDFSWTLNSDAIESTGTFADGSHWIVPAADADLKLYSTTPRNTKNTLDITAFGETTPLTVYRNGVSINEKVGYEHNSLDDLISLTNTQVTGGWRTTDNRHSKIFNNATTIQSQLDVWFDVNTFESRRTILDGGTAGSGIGLTADDSIVLTRSYWDPSDNLRPPSSSSWSDGIMLTGEDTRTAVAQTAVLSVLSAAPSESCFRPPIQWSDSDRANRPMYPVSQFDHTNWGITQGHAAHISQENANNIEVPLDRILTSPFLHTQGGYLYASSFPREAFANEDSGYGNRIVKGFNAAICELYNSNITDETDESKLNLLYRMVQYGIDNLGTINRRAYTAAGAGQKPALSAPWMQLSLSALGVTHGIDSVMRTFMPGASGLVSGSTSMAAVKQRCFHEDYTLRQVVTEDPDYWTTVGYTGCGRQLGSSAGYGATLDLSNINGGVLADLDGNNVLEPKDGYSDGIQLTYPLGKGMGRIDFTETPMELINTISWNGSNASTVSTPPKASYAMNYIGCRLGIKQNSNEIEKIYTLTMLSENAGAYNKANNSNSSGSCSFWVDRPLDSQPGVSSEIRLYPFTTDDNGAWIFCKEGATRPDGSDPYAAGSGASATLGVIMDTSVDLRSAAYESTAAISWIPIYTLIRNNYSKMGLPVSNIGEAINGYMATILEQTTNNDRRWMLMYGAENGWFDDIIPATDPLYWLSHSGITSASKYLLPGTEKLRAFGGRPYYEIFFAGRTGDAIDRMHAGPDGVYVEATGCSSRDDINRYGSSTLRYGTVGSDNPTMQHWFSPELGTPFTITDNANGQGIYPNNGEIAALDNVVSTFENLPGGTVDAIYTISGVTYVATATISEASPRVGKFDVTFVSGASADEFRTEAIGVSGSGATIGIQYTPQIKFAASSDPQQWRVIPYRKESTYDRETVGGATLTSPGGEGEQFFNWMFRSKHNNDRVYGAHDCAVPWVTEDNGDTWKKLKSEFLYGRQVQSMLESPDDEDVLFVTMSDYDNTKDYGRRLRGIYRSEDRGRSFKLLRRQSNIPINEDIGRDRTNEDVLVYDPTLVNGERVYYWATDGEPTGVTKDFYRSYDGIEWEPVQSGALNDYGYTGPDGRYRRLIYHFQTAVHRTNHKVFLACDAGLFVSHNAHSAAAGGVTFAPVDSAGTTLPHWFTSVVFDPIDDDVMYASSQSPGVKPTGDGSFAGFGDGNIWKSTDAGETWNVHMSRELLGYTPTSVSATGDMTFTPYNIFLSSVTGDTAWVISGPFTDGKYRSFFFDDFSNPDYTRPVEDRIIYNLDEGESNSVWRKSLTGARSQVAPYPDINRKNEALIQAMAIICGTTNGTDFRYSQDWFKGENWSSMAFDPEDDRQMYAASEDTAISTAVCDSKTGEILYWGGVPGNSNIYTGWFTTKKIVIDGDRLYTARGYSIGKRKLLRHPNRFELKYNTFEIPPNGVDYKNLDTSTTGSGTGFIGPNNTKVEDFTSSADNKFVPHNFEEFFKHPITGRIASGDNISTDPTGSEFVPIPSLRTDHQLAGARAISSEVFGMSIDQSNDDVYLWAVNGATGNRRDQILRGLWGGTAGISWDYVEKNLDSQTTNPAWPRDKYNFGDTSYALECHSKDPNIMWARVVPSGANNRFDGHLYRYDHSGVSGSRWTELNYIKDSAESYSEAGITASIQDDNGQNYPTPSRQMNVIGGIVHDPNGGSLYPDGVLYVTPYYASGHIIYRSTDLGTSFDHMDYDLPCLSNTKIELNPITGELVRGGCDGSYVHPPPIGYERRDDYATMWGRGWTLINPTYPT